VTDGTLLKLLDQEVHTTAVMGLAWRPDGKILASASSGEVRFWTPDGTLQDSHQYKAALGGTRIAYPKIGTELLVGATVIGTGKGRVRVRCTDMDDDDDDPKEPRKPDDPPATAGGGERARAIALSPDGKTAAFGGVDKLVLWNAAGMGQVKALMQLGGKGRSIKETYWSADGSKIGWEEQDARQTSHSFDFSALQLGTALEKADGKTVHELGSITLKKSAPNQLEILNDGKQESVINIGAEIQAFTFVGVGNIAVGTGFGLRLFNKKTGKGIRTYHGTGGIRVVAPIPGEKPALFLSSGLDRVIRIWTLERDHPLMSLFVSGNDWIVWTPEGYFASSLGGERLIGWQVNNGAEQLATFHAASEFRASLNRSDVMKLVLKEKSLKAALDLAEKAKPMQEAPPSEVESLLPPKATIIAPTKAIAIVDAKVTVRVRGESTGRHALTRLQLLLDGRPYPGPSGLQTIAAGSPKQVERDFNIALPPGTHSIAVRAESAVSQATSTAVEVTYVIKDPTKEEPRLHVLSIGIDAYKPGGPRPLKCAVKDATELASSLSAGSKGLFGSASVTLLTDKTATRSGILTKLNELKNAMHHQDTAVIFYAGHGQPSGGKFYLLPQDVNVDNIDATAVSGNELKEALNGMPGRVLLILDACHSALIGIDGLVGGLKEEAGVVVMISAQGSEKSLENRTLGHGYFTQALIEGLHGNADYNKDGYVYLSELVLYVETEVDRMSEGRQRPAVGKPPSIPSFPLAKVSTIAK
jgi:WD40 repeat protein